VPQGAQQFDAKHRQIWACSPGKVSEGNTAVESMVRASRGSAAPGSQSNGCSQRLQGRGVCQQWQRSRWRRRYQLKASQKHAVGIGSVIGYRRIMFKRPPAIVAILANAAVPNRNLTRRCTGQARQCTAEGKCGAGLAGELKR